MKTYRKKQLDVQAVQWDGSFEVALEIIGWVTENGGEINYREFEDDEEDAVHLVVHGSAGAMRVDPGDWIIRGVAGEFYQCPGAVFTQTYEEV